LSPHLLPQHGYGFATSSQRSPVAPTKGGVERKITSEEAGSNLLEYDFCLLLVHELSSQKNLCNKENLLLNWSYYTLKFSFFSFGYQNFDSIPFFTWQSNKKSANKKRILLLQQTNNQLQKGQLSS
jgi:hypothetical protein